MADETVRCAADCDDVNTALSDLDAFERLLDEQRKIRLPPARARGGACKVAVTEASVMGRLLLWGRRSVVEQG